jgi:hypothetical protein
MTRTRPAPPVDPHDHEVPLVDVRPPWRWRFAVAALAVLVAVALGLLTWRLGVVRHRSAPAPAPSISSSPANGRTTARSRTRTGRGRCRRVEPRPGRVGPVPPDLRRAVYDAPWCGVELLLVIHHGGLDMPANWISVLLAQRWGEEHDRWSRGSAGTRAGDALVIGGPGVHIEWAREDARPDGSVPVHGGNTSPGSEGSQDDGGTVAEKVRAASEVYGRIRSTTCTRGRRGSGRGRRRSTVATPEPQYVPEAGHGALATRSGPPGRACRATCRRRARHRRRRRLLRAGAGGATVTTTSEPAVDPEPGVPSWATGEFYVAIAPLVVAILGAVTHGAVVPGQVEKELAAIGAVVAGAYALARTLLKATHVHAQAKVAAAASMSAAAVARSSSGGAVADRVNLDAVAAHAARHAVDAKAIAGAVADVLDDRFVLRRRAVPRKKSAARRGG